MRVVVFGGGYAGIVAVTRLERRLPESAEIVLVDQRPTHLIKHELHRVIRRPEFAAELQIPFADILKRAQFDQRTIASIDFDAGAATFEDGEQLSYDAGIVALGSRPNYYGLDGVEEHSVPIATPADATAIADSMADLLEDRSGTVVVAGAGLAGVQVAGELAAVRNDTDVTDVSIILIERASEIVPGSSARFQEAIRQALTERNVEIRTDTTVSGADDSVVGLADTLDIPADLFVWAGGIQGQALFDGDRPRVRADLRLGDRTFGAGDAVQAIDEDGSLVEPTAQAAVGMATVAADNAILRAQADDQTGFRPAYHRYRETGESRIVTVGDTAVAQLGPTVVTGPAARALKSVVGVRYLSAAGAIENALTVFRSEFDLAHPRAGRELDRDRL
ncbi:NADH dehydrogenase [Halodesulfurarchaeum formicicum]|uniref:NADH dehydrogenase n=1 Tax=Halodesulfurarchaeum formicicum TaxID=1873524 RepID=A0A1D8S4F5_9EURY|nr:FAD-dependent oxidoreductase [Halodesulfurarchaeum formicicum]AOW80227.1 NADH dehydrogenase [Halodesulfurarchaeum formicicum]